MRAIHVETSRINSHLINLSLDSRYEARFVTLDISLSLSLSLSLSPSPSPSSRHERFENRAIILFIYGTNDLMHEHGTSKTTTRNLSRISIISSRLAPPPLPPPRSSLVPHGVR